MKDRISEREFRLSEEEALALLDIVMICPIDLTAEQRTAILKLSDFCREYLRDEMQEPREILPLRSDIALSTSLYAA